MNIKTVWGVYFSATGTTQTVVTHTAKAMAAELGAAYKSYSFSLPDARKSKLAFSMEDLVVFGMPVYAGRIPNLLLPFIKDAVAGNGAFATPVVLFGNRSFDDALIELRDILQKNGFHILSAGAFVGEHSFSKTLGAGRPDDDDLKLAAKLGAETAKIASAISGLPVKPVAVTGNTPIGPYYTPRDRFGNPIHILKVKPKTNMDICTRCGICAAVCTMGAISAQNTGEISGTCIKCCACVKKCPVQAKYFDDAGFLYHRQELEDTYRRRANVELFF